MACPSCVRQSVSCTGGLTHITGMQMPLHLQEDQHLWTSGRILLLRCNASQWRCIVFIAHTQKTPYTCIRPKMKRLECFAKIATTRPNHIWCIKKCYLSTLCYSCRSFVLILVAMSLFFPLQPWTRSAKLVCSRKRRGACSPSHCMGGSHSSVNSCRCNESLFSSLP